jgi:octaprenyl-diphosphate synthase
MFQRGWSELAAAAARPPARPRADRQLPAPGDLVHLAHLERGLLHASRGAPPELRGAAEALVGAGGKRVRPLLVLLAARAASEGRRPRGQLALALAAELVHSATLLHDDVIDDGLTRRGRPAPRVTYGNAVSVLAGDWLLTTALDLCLRSRSPGAVPAVVRALRELVEGEAIQLRLRGDVAFTVADALNVSRLKTGALFAFCGEAGGLAAAAAGDRIAALRAFGQGCGQAFQIVDDLLDLEAEEATLGKAVLADVVEGKASLPLAIALEREPSLRAELAVLAAVAAPAEDSGHPPAASAAPGPGPGEAQQARLLAFVGRVRDTGALVQARAVAARERDAALQALRSLPGSPSRDLLEQVAEALLSRRA